jgi:hypothetical protein
MAHRIIFSDGERELTSFTWTLGLDAAIQFAPQFMGACGATDGIVLDGLGREVWSHACRAPADLARF